MNKSSRDDQDFYVGIHLAGAQTRKTTLAVGRSHGSSLEITRVYEGVGSFRHMSSDDRILAILESLPALPRRVFVDVPLSLPPCVRCTLDHCPGVSRCSDVSVAYMLSIHNERKRKKAPNPQAHRLFDLLFDFEPSFSAHMVPLVVRAITLQKRLSQTGIQLEETHISRSLAALFGEGFLPYRKFEKGKAIREKALAQCIQHEWLLANDRLSSRVETFDAILACMLSFLTDQDRTLLRPPDFVPQEGWVYLPKC